ncbi:MAG: galactose mutarotase [Clostridia bacterium]|nr:galactose mutarotase [Clostridia bacterium]
MQITPYGLHNGQEIFEYTLQKGAFTAKVINYGAILTHLSCPDKNGKETAIVLARENLEEYRTLRGCYGATIGRFANRIENGRFTLGGKTYQIRQNENGNSLHGGIEGFHKKVWQVTDYQEDAITLSYFSPDGEEGFPGNMTVTVTFSLTEEGLSIAYTAKSDADTVVSLTNHAYFNPNGTDADTQGLLLQISAQSITPVDEKLIPHGELAPVQGTLFDFRTPRPFVCDLSANPTLAKRGCYDENFVLDGDGFRRAGSVYGDKTGITVSVYTDMPGMQIYTGNKNGIALETQRFPNAVNCPSFPSALLQKDALFQSKTLYALSLK